MYTSLSGQLAVTKQLDLIANNLANVNTTGYKSERPLFEKVLNDKDLLLSSSLKKDIQAPSTFKTHDFIRLRGSFADFSQGPIETTSNPLDAAIDGPGFFVVQTPEGERYTRAGNFRVDEAGKLVTQSGYIVQGQGGEITIPSGLASIATDGSIKVGNAVAGKLRIVQIAPQDVNREAGQLFSVKEGATASDATDAKVTGGALEGSNVNAVRELADMILASRLFESFKQSEEASSRMNQARNEKVGTTQG